MTCAPSSRIAGALGATALGLLSATIAPAQQPTSAPTSSPSVLAPYRSPVIALVQPASPPAGTGSVPLDRPVVVFRFAAGEPDDPLDARSFAAAVDGQDRTALFQQTATQAWGPLTDSADVQHGRFTIGAHRVTARICSSRGACATSETQLLVTPPLVTTAAPSAATPSVARRVLSTVLSATRRLLVP